MVAPRPEIAAMLYENRFRRYVPLSSHIPKVKGECAWCGGPSKLKYCSPECSTEADMRGGFIDHHILSRDKGVCAVCGIDTLEINNAVAQLRRTLWESRHRDDEGTYCVGSRYYPRHQFNRFFTSDGWGPFHQAFRSSMRYWQADHIIPVVDGGGCCGLENFQTLCMRCHKEDTKQLAHRRSKKWNPTVKQLALFAD